MTAIVLFAKNEEKIIGRVIDELHCVLTQIPELRAKLFLCNDSTDRTGDIARGRGVEMIKGMGKGLGWSYYFALYFLSKRNFSSIITIDGDGQTDLSELPQFYEEFKRGSDLVVGSRFLKKSSISYNYSKINFLGVQILSSIITVSTFQKFTDSHGGLRLMRSSVAKDFNFLAGHSYVQETIIDSVARGFQVKELPSKWNKRAYGESRVVQSRLKYMKAMAGPLLLRMRIHWLGALFGLALLIFSQNIFYVWLIACCALIEIYKLWIFKQNNLQIKKHLANVCYT